MSQPSERNLALFIDFDNVAIGARDSRQRFDVRLLLQRVLEKGKVVVKRAYADWHYYKEHMTSLHEAAIELIEVPAPKISGKNSADIRLVVDAIDLCYAKGHIDTFVIVSGDSDFSPLVSKLRENDKRVIGIGVRSSASHLLIANCDEFIFYDDIYNSAVNMLTEKVSSVPQDLRLLFDFLLQTTQSLLQESRGVLYSSLLKDTMKRKQPEFNEANYGYTTFGELLEDARDRGLLEVERDSRAGGTLVVLGLGKSEVVQESRVVRSRRRRRDRARKNGHEHGVAAAAPAGEAEAADKGEPAAAAEATSAAAGGDRGSKPDAATGEAAAAAGQSAAKEPSRSSRRSNRRRSRKKTRTPAANGESGAKSAAPDGAAGEAGRSDAAREKPAAPAAGETKEAGAPAPAPAPGPEPIPERKQAKKSVRKPRTQSTKQTAAQKKTAKKKTGKTVKAGGAGKAGKAGKKASTPATKKTDRTSS